MIKDKISLSEYKHLINEKNTKIKANKYGVSNKSDRIWSGFFRGRLQSIVFDSKAEMNRFIELELGQKINIKELSLQERFLIGTDPVTYYVADFYYYDIFLYCWVVEDVKGYKTKIYEKKKKLFQKKYPDILFKEIKK